jgi:hypothetical protein
MPRLQLLQTSSLRAHSRKTATIRCMPRAGFDDCVITGICSELYARKKCCRILIINILCDFHSYATGDFIGKRPRTRGNRRGTTGWRDGFTLKTLSPRYLSDTAATAVSSLSIPLSTLIGIERRIAWSRLHARILFGDRSPRSGETAAARTSGGLHLFCEWLDFEDLTVSAEGG